MTLTERIHEAIKKAEHGKFSLDEFDHEYRELKKDAKEESAPLLEAGQRNHADNLKMLLDGFHSLRPEVKHHEEEAAHKHSKKKEKSDTDEEKVDV